MKELYEQKQINSQITTKERLLLFNPKGDNPTRVKSTQQQLLYSFLQLILKYRTAHNQLKVTLGQESSTTGQINN